MSADLLVPSALGGSQHRIWRRVFGRRILRWGQHQGRCERTQRWIAGPSGNHFGGMCLRGALLMNRGGHWRRSRR